MGFGNNELAFNLSDLMQLRKDTKKVCDDLVEQRKSLKKGLNQLRKDWNTDGGRYFFEQIDDNWESDVKKYEKTLAIYEEVLTDAIEQFEKVEAKAKAIQMELP